MVAFNVVIVICIAGFFVFFFSSRRRHTRCLIDWSSDVCSSDLFDSALGNRVPRIEAGVRHPRQAVYGRTRVRTDRHGEGERHRPLQAHRGRDHPAGWPQPEPRNRPRRIRLVIRDVSASAKPPVPVGDPVAECYSRHADRLRLVLLRLSRSPQLAEDLSQHIWVKVAEIQRGENTRAQDLTSFQTPAAQWSYLSRMALNRYRDWLRQKRTLSIE